jgi:hypothetical protein
MLARFRMLLLATVVLLLVWYFSGGRQEIAWYEDVRAAAKHGWDISGADRFPQYGIAYYGSLFGIFIVFVVATVRVIDLIAKKVLRSKV